jgi:type I restriction enzyme S subunit
MSKQQPYTAYYPVKYDYVSQLPDDWKLLPNIAIFRERIERGFDNEELLSVTIGKGVIRQSENDIKKDSSNEDKSKYKLIKVGDIAYNRMRMWQGALGYSDYQGITSPAYVVLKPRMEINQRFFHYMFRTGFYTNYSKRFSYGIVDDQLSLRYVDFKRMYSIVPPLETQNAIVAYLDRKTQQIQEFIAKKERLIELLEEEKQTIINKSVIQGIDKNIKFKETDLGHIPEHWEIKRLGTLGRFFKGGNISREELTTFFVSDDDVSAILYGDIYTKYNIEVTTVINKVSKKTAVKSVKLNKGDLLFTGSGETKEDIGKCVLFNSDLETFAGGDVIIFKQRHVDGLFLSYSQNSNLAKYQRYLSAKGEIIIHTYGSLLRNVYMPFPPSIEEQKQIATYIKNECLKIDNAIFKAKSEIEKAKEYQESLITQIVTGQLKVPENAKSNLGQDIDLGMVAEPNTEYHSNN